MKTKLKNSIHGIMLMKGIQVSNACTHTFTLQYMEKLKELNDYRINHYISLIGGVTYHGNITKTGSKHLRWIMLECVHAHIRSDKNSNITRFYQRLAKKKGNSKAAVAAASKVLRVVYWIMKEQREYHRCS